MADHVAERDLATAAVAYARAGLAVFPLQPDKSPYRRAEHPDAPSQHDATTDGGLVAQWWQRWPRSLVGHRVAPGHLLLDVDPRHGGDRVWRALKAEHGEIPLTRRHMSGRRDGGGHVWFQRPEGRLTVAPLVAWAQARGLGHNVGSDERPKWTAGIDLLQHDHRYTILPPSPHPETGQAYEWRGDADTPVLAMPPWLAALVTQPEVDTLLDTATANGQVNGNHAPFESDGDSIADWFTATSTWAELLVPAGWRCVGGDGEHDGSLWRHPNATQAHSASIRHGCLFVYTPNSVFEETTPGDKHGYTRFRAWAELEHQGDASAAALAARERKDGPIVRIDVESLIADAGTPATNGKASVQPAAPAPWEDPLPLEGPPPPPYPLDALPGWVGDHCAVVADRLQVPVDLCGQLALGVLAAVAMKQARVRVTGEWIEPLNLYLTTVMPSGSGKSPAARAITSVLNRFEDELLDLHASTRRQAEIEHAVAERRAKKALEAASKEDGDIAGALAAAAVVETIDVPPEPRLIASDATPEVLAQLLDRHGGRIALVSTEAELYDIVLGDKTQRVKLAPYLKPWDGDHLIVDRKGGGGSPGTEIRVKDPLLTVSITVQPGALDLLRTKPELVSRGFVQRFCYAWPASLVGQRTWDPDRDTTVPTRPDWERRVLALGHRLHSFAVAADLSLDEPARRRFFAWRQELEDTLGADDGRAEFVAKLTASAVRVAALLHLAEDRHLNTPVALDLLERGIELGRYWLGHADAVWLQFGTDSSLAGARVVLAWLRSTRPETFTRRDAYKDNRRRFPKASEADAAIAALAEHGWVRAVGTGVKGSQRDNAVWQPHPSILTVEGS